MTGPENAVRFGLFPSFYYAKDRATGELSGFGIELARRFAAAQGRPLQLTEYGAPPGVVKALKDGDCDVGFLGIDPGRGADVDFSPPCLRADFSFLVQVGSPIDRIADVDRPGHRVAVVRNHAMDFALEGKLHHADRVFATTPDEAFDMVRTGQADILAGIRPGLLRYAGLLRGARVLPDRYGENVLALAVAKGRADRRAAVDRFILDARASGLLRQIIATTRLAGAEPVLTD